MICMAAYREHYLRMQQPYFDIERERPIRMRHRQNSDVTYVCVCACMGMYACMYVCGYVYATCIHIHTYLLVQLKGHDDRHNSCCDHHMHALS